MSAQSPQEILDVLAQDAPACKVARDVAGTVVGIPTKVDIIDGGDVLMRWVRDRVTVELIVFRQPRTDGAPCGTLHYKNTGEAR